CSAKKWATAKAGLGRRVRQSIMILGNIRRLSDCSIAPSCCSRIPIRSLHNRLRCAKRTPRRLPKSGAAWTKYSLQLNRKRNDSPSFSILLQKAVKNFSDASFAKSNEKLAVSFDDII